MNRPTQGHTHKVTPTEAAAHTTNHTHLQPQTRHTPTCPASQGLAHPSPAVAAPRPLSLLPKAALPSTTGAGLGSCWAWVGAGGLSAQYPQALWTFGARWRAGLRGAGSAAKRASATALPPPESFAQLAQASRFRVRRGGATQRGRGGAA